MNLIEKMQHSIDSMSRGEKFLASLQITLLGLIIVFIALIMLYFVINFMTKLLNGDQKKPVSTKTQITPTTNQVKEPLVEEATEEETMDNNELVAIISAAIAATLNTSTHNIIVRNIVRVTDATPTWGKVGRINQVNQ